MATQYTPLGYCDEQDIENFLLTDINDSFSSQISTWIAVAEKWVNDYLGYTTASGVLREEFTSSIENNATVDTEGNLMIFPKKTPVSSVSAISLVKGTDSLSLTLTAGGENKFQIAENQDYILYPGSELSLTGSSIVESFFDIRHTKFFAQMDYIAGYETVPAPIHLATVNVVSDYVMRHDNKSGLQSVGQGGINKSWFQREAGESDFIKDAKALLNPYRIGNWIQRT